MAELLRTKEAELTTADLASYGIPQKQTDGPKLVKDQEPEKQVAAVTQRLAEGFANERAGLEKLWDRGDNVSTEDLRVALQRYRSFFDRLLKL